MEYIIFPQKSNGIISAWVARRKYPTHKIISWGYHYPTPDFLKSGDRLTIIDFKFAPNVLNQWQKQKIEVELIQPDGFECGATLAWKTLFASSPMPVFLEFVRDWELRKFELEQTKLVMDAIAALGKTFKVFDVLGRMDYDELIKFCDRIPKSQRNQKQSFQQSQHRQTSRIVIPKKSLSLPRN